MRRSRPPAWAIAASLAVLLAQFLRIPPLRDAATGLPLEGKTLVPSLAHLLTTPVSATADWVSCFSVHQLVSFLGWFVAAWALLRPLRATPWRGPAREARGFATHVGGVLAFAAWTVLAPRPVARFAPAPGNGSRDLVVDLHSHTRYSWDGVRSFTPERNMAWHRELGYDAAFITDHNVFDGARIGFDATLLSWRQGGLAALRGTELSLHGAHVVVLGNREPIDPRGYEGPDGLVRFLRESRARWGALAVLSLPEYWRHHRDELPALADAGAAGLEIANGSPKAELLPPSGRARVVELCRARNLFLAGVSDNHGWSRSACAATLVTVDGARGLDAERLERAVLDRLAHGGFAATRVAERPILRPEGTLALVLDPWRNLWRLLRTLSLAQAFVCFLYIGIVTALTRPADAG
ncbi:MAG: PHP domain-containing protein [Elusimicrobia bacterium]|nr:PHP domain-containing protein [Elusimicrobiota bacterium]